MKRAILINGSPNTNGNTSRLVKSMISGVNQEKTSLSVIYLSTIKRLNHCIGCNKCKTSDKHMCVFDDGLNEIIADVRSSDVLIISSPIYFFNFNSLTKAFIDRLFYSSEISNDENMLKGKEIAVLLTYGLDNIIESGAKNAIQSIYDVSRFVGLKLIGVVEGSFSDDEKKNENLLYLAKNLGSKIS